MLDASSRGLRVHERRGGLDAMVRQITHDSRAVRPGALFFCFAGEHTDGHRFAADAVARGAVALVVERPLGIGTPQLVVDGARAAMGVLAASFFDHPSDSMAVVGVTGTNGKTTTTHLLAAVFERAGWRAGVIGTLSGSHTTPEAPELQARLAGFRDQGMRAVAMEVSSHALALHRVDGTRFAAAVFTNLGQDHLDFHGSVERYFAAKARLFAPEFSALGVVDVDDAHGRLLRDAAAIPIVPFSLDDAADVDVAPTRANFRWRGHEVELSLGGWFNVANAARGRDDRGGARSRRGRDRGRAVRGAAGAGALRADRRRPGLRGDRRLRPHPRQLARSLAGGAPGPRAAARGVRRRW